MINIFDRMTNKTTLLPSYQRFVNGIPMPLFARRSFRIREKYLILLVFLTFGIVCFSTFFFLPDFGSGTGISAYNSVYKVYQSIQKAGPEFLIPAPPHGATGNNDPHGPGGYPHAVNVGLERPGDAYQDIHVLEDKQKLQAKIDEEYEQQKTLEKPEVDEKLNVPATSSVIPLSSSHRLEEAIRTVPPAPADVLPMTEGGEDKDPTARERREVVKKFSGVNVVTFYCVNMLTEVSGPENAYLATLVLDAVRLIFSIVACWMTASYPRRLLTGVSGFGTALTLFALSSCLLADYGKPWLPIVLLFVYTCMVTVGLVPLPWLLCGELFTDATTRGLGSGLCAGFAFFCFFTVVKTGPIVLEILEPEGTFAVYGTIVLVGTVFLRFWLPETKDKSLEEIENVFARNSTAPKKKTPNEITRF